MLSNTSYALAFSMHSTIGIAQKYRPKNISRYQYKEVQRERERERERGREARCVHSDTRTTFAAPADAFQHGLLASYIRSMAMDLISFPSPSSTCLLFFVVGKRQVGMLNQSFEVSMNRFCFLPFCCCYCVGSNCRHRIHHSNSTFV